MKEKLIIETVITFTEGRNPVDSNHRAGIKKIKTKAKQMAKNCKRKQQLAIVAIFWSKCI